MARYLQRRLLLVVPTVLLTSVLVFLLLYLIPGDPASIYIGENKVTPERLEQIRHEMGLDRPLYVQYVDFVVKAVQGDLGRSLQTRKPVTQEIMAQIVDLKMRITEVPVPTRYFPAASSASFVQSSVYGLSILWLLARYAAHRRGWVRSRQFDSLERRYRGAA